MAEQLLRRSRALAHDSYARVMASSRSRGWLSLAVRASAVAVAVAMVAAGCAQHIDRPSGGGGVSNEQAAPAHASASRPTFRPVPSAISLAELHGKLATSSRSGQLVAVSIPATHGAFRHRWEMVYLPPVWFGSAGRHPALPVIELIPGTHGGPASWVHRGQAIQTEDAYAAAHHGWAPILAFVDADGLGTSDSECVNGPLGMAEDHLALDVPAYIEHTFGASTNPAQWGVLGFSMGGTCAIDLTIGHPNVFRHFVDLAGDIGPNVGDKAQTIQTLYGGSVAAWNAHDPFTVLSKSGRFPAGMSGWFGVGDMDVAHISPARILAAATARDGIKTSLAIGIGGHDWGYGTAAFRQTLPWLAQQFTHA